MIVQLSTGRERVGREVFGVGLRAIAAAYWRELSDATLETFYAVLGGAMTDLEWHRLVEEAIGPGSRDRTFPPTPGELLAILDAQRQAERPGVDLLEEAEADELALRVARERA